MSGCWFLLELDSSLGASTATYDWTVPLMLDAEAILGSYLRAHPAVAALDARVAGRTPSSQTLPWVRVTQLDATDDTVSNIEYVLDYMIQFDCYAGEDATRAHTAQAEASLLVRTVRAALKGAEGQVVDGLVVSSVRFTGMVRIPDADFEPARERYVLTAEITGHA